MPNQPHAMKARSRADEVGAADPVERAGEDRERDAVLRPRVAVQQHRDQDEQVAQRDREERLHPVHAELDEPGGEQVAGDVVRHADPQRREVVRGPGALLDRVRASSSLKYGLSAIVEKSRSSTRPSGWVICVPGSTAVVSAGGRGSTAIAHLAVTLPQQWPANRRGCCGWGRISSIFISEWWVSRTRHGQRQSVHAWHDRGTLCPRHARTELSIGAVDGLAPPAAP